jgi:hypothetical protein
MKTKIFDCVEMKRSGAVKVHRVTRGMSLKAEADFWRKQTQALRRQKQETKP